jgi:CRP-like cAMP-binding protein
VARTPTIVQVISSAKEKGNSYPAATDCPTLNAQFPPKNSIIAGLPYRECNHLQSHLRPVSWRSRQILHDVAAPLDCVYFPESGMVCTFAVMDDGRTVALAAIGREGFLGVSAFLGAESALLRTVVVIDGDALKLSRVELERILPTCPQLAASLRRYSSSYLAQVAINGACHALHSVQQRVAFWLLIVGDRTAFNSLPLTHESLSELLGCTRSSVTGSLLLLENARVIRCGRGQISILDHARLAQYTCECYRVANDRAAFGWNL